MSLIQLKSFQEDAVTALVDELHYHLNSRSKITPRLIFQAPTGSGKTVMAGEVLERLFNLDPEVVVLWASIGTGGLHHQSKEKFIKQLPKDIQVLSAEDSILGGRTVLEGRTIVTVSWQGINVKKGDMWANVIMRDGEKLNFRELIHQTQAQRPVLLFIDEAHTTAKSKRSREIIATFNPFLVLEISATPEYEEFKKDDTLESWVWFNEKSLLCKGYRVDPKRVSQEGLICKQMKLNDGVIEDATQTSFNLLLDAAYRKHCELKKGYKPYGINPLLLVQIPDSAEGDLLRQRVEDYFRNYNITTENRRLNVWLSEDHILSEGLTYHHSSVEVLIFKQAINTGWDCPRAKVLVQFRNVKKEETEIQVLGRILRMPEQKHYDNDLLNTAFVYTDIEQPTLSEDIKSLGVIKDLVSRRNLSLPYSLTSYYHGRKVYNHLIMEDLVPALKDGLTRHFNLDFNTYASEGLNLERLKEKGMILSEGLVVGTLSKGDSLVGEFDSIQYDSIQVLKDKEQVALECKSFLKKYLRPFGDQDFETNYQTFMDALRRLFIYHVSETTTPSLIQYHMTTYRETWEACLTDIIDFYRTHHEDEATYKEYEYEWSLPTELVFAREEVDLDLVFKRYAYSPSFLLQKRSKPEREFESVLESHPDVEWWYKNGDAGREHLGIGYTTADGVRRTFYPDYLVKTLDDTLWVYETKGYGEANNDENIEEKAKALIRFLERHQQSGINIEGAIISPNFSNWYAYKIKTGEPFDSSRCWEGVTLFTK